MKNLEKLTPHEKAELLRLIEKIPTTTECIDCKFWDGGFCKKWNDNIPKENIKSGCDEWIFDPNAPPF